MNNTNNEIFVPELPANRTVTDTTQFFGQNDLVTENDEHHIYNIGS